MTREALRPYEGRFVRRLVARVRTGTPLGLPTLDAGSALRVLAEHGVKVVVVGSAALAAHGLHERPNDLDIATECSEDNLRRLAGALSEMRARRFVMPSGLVQRIYVIIRARRSGHSWIEIGRAVVAWSAAKLRPHAPDVPIARESAHDPNRPPPEAFGLAHEIVLATDHGLITCICFEIDSFAAMRERAVQRTIDGESVSVQTPDVLESYYRAYGHLLGWLRSRRLAQM
jgi:hypothetical protein